MGHGFYVKVTENDYLGPFLRLNEARDAARQKGPNLEIYHGELKYKPDGILDTSDLDLIPKVK